MSQPDRQQLPYGVPPGTPDFPSQPVAPAGFAAAPGPGVPHGYRQQLPYAAQPQPSDPQPYGGQPGAAPQAGAYAGQPYGVTQQAGGEQHYPGGMMSCRLCGSVPAAAATFRGHQGIVIVMNFLRADGPFCRDCGLATFRRMTSRTLVQGWWGWASFLITPITVLINLARRGKVARLAAPQPHPYAPSRPPLDPGPRLLHRPMSIIGLSVPFALIMLVVIVNALPSS